MKRILLINFALSFMALMMIDADATPMWAVGLMFAWFVVSAFLLKRKLPEILKDEL